jgi:LmbE family N-acetylglucosaminyl deacetylase
MKLFSRWTIAVMSILPMAAPIRAQFPAAPGTGPGLPETIEAIDSARVTTRILYITAHPDDESAAVLTYLARGLHADVALLSLTRGEGGQNALGPEQAPQLGLIRTQELLAATRGYGVKLYFTRARDFGYSKTPEETEKIWGDQVLEDMVRVIRAFRPNIVINGWGGVHTGHGHHQLSGIWTPKAVRLAADANAYPNLTKEGLPPWNLDPDLPVILDIDRASDHPQGYVLPLDDISPLYGKSWRQIGLDAFVNHRTQGIAGFLNSPFLRRPIATKREDGKPFDPKILSQRLVDENCAEAREIDALLLAARHDVLSLNTQSAVQNLAKAAAESKHVCDRPVTLGPGGTKFDRSALEEDLRLQRIERALELSAGMELGALADRSELVAGDSFTVDTLVHCRPEASCSFGDPKLLLPNGWTLSGEKAAEPGSHQFHVVAGNLPKDTNVVELLPAEPKPLVEFRQPVTIAGFSYAARKPAVHIDSSSTSVQLVPLRLVPAYTLAVEPKQTVEVLRATHEPFDVLLRVHSYSTKPAKVSIGLDVPDGLKAGAPAEVEFTGIGDQYVKLTVTPPAKLESGNFAITAYAKRGDEKFTTTLEPLPSMPTILWSEPAQCIVHAFDINVPANLRIGYISAEGEPIPDALKRLGIAVEMLDTNALAFGDLSKFDAIVVGVRAYELRPELAEANKRLLDFVSKGGTLIVQYNRDYVWDKLQPAPYPAKIGSPTPRITDEESPVKFLLPADPLLNRPNKISELDFQSWVQERGLYFWRDFDSRYTAPLAMNDPGEKDLNGGLVYTKFGKGTYIYTGLAFFRELPDGVPGAYRLFVNLLCASKTN